MDLVANCKEKLTYFRIKELKDVLTQLGLSKQGKKQDLVDRILTILSDEQAASKMWSKKSVVGKEEVAKLVDDTYRKMQVSGANDLASKGQGGSTSSDVKIKGEVDDTSQDMKIRCLCGSTLETESMIKCEDIKCLVWQHMSCVIIPEKPTEGTPPLPDLFYCELCRLSRADPFWSTVSHPLCPVKLITTSVPTDGSNPVQTVERTFQITRVDKDLVALPEYDVQAWCMLLNDKVTFRMQWPQYAELQVNGVPVRAINRPGSQLLGANGRDDGPIITPCIKDGINKISLTGCDARVFCLGVRIVKRRTVQQILNMIPKEADGERFEDALARVSRVSGSNAADNADSDSDVEVVAENFVINLRCPMSGSRMKVAGRFKPCAHMGCFDLEVFVELNQRSRKWQCPTCLKNYSLENVIIDPYFNLITSKMRHCGEDVTDVELKPDGSWRVKFKTEIERRELGDLVHWHSPNGTLCLPLEVKPRVETTIEHVKQECFSEGHTNTGLKLGIKKNRNGLWEVSKPEDINTLSSGNKAQERLTTHDPKVIPMSSSATGSGRDGEDASVNQDGGTPFDITSNGGEPDSMSLNIGSGCGFRLSAPSGNAEIIVLSDSEEETDMQIPSEPAYNGSRSEPAYNGSRSEPAYNGSRSEGVVNFAVIPSSMADSYPDDPNLGTGTTSCLGHFNSNMDEFGMPLWPHPVNQGGPGFQLFTSDFHASDALVDLHHGPVNCSPMNGFLVEPETSLMPAPLLPGSLGGSDTDINDSLVDNTLPYGGDDPSLQMFLPPRDSDAAAQSRLRDQGDISNGLSSDDWISLRVGDSAAGGRGESSSAAATGLNSNQLKPSTNGAMDSMTDNASLLLGMNDSRYDKPSQKRSESPFSFPRQKRSVRPRLYLSIDSDSDE